MKGEEAECKGLGKEHVLRHEAPVYGPLVEELTGKLKGSGKIGGCLFAEGVAKGDLLEIS